MALRTDVLPLTELADDELVARFREGDTDALNVAPRALPPLRPGQGPRLLPRRCRLRRHRAGGDDRPLQGGPRLPARAPGVASGPSPSCASPARSSPPSRRRPARSTSRSTSTSRSAGCGAATTRASARSRTCSTTTTSPTRPTRSCPTSAWTTCARSMAEMLSGLEVDVLRLYVEGKSYQEIGEHLGRHVKSIDNALQRIKRKLDVHLSERDAAELTLA